MAGVPQGFQSAKEGPLFKKIMDDPTITPDRATAAVEGYFRIPAVWIGKFPVPESVLTLTPQIHHAVVLRKDLGCDIKVCVQCDDTFLFDFSS